MCVFIAWQPKILKIVLPKKWKYHQFGVGVGCISFHASILIICRQAIYDPGRSQQISSSCNAPLPVEDRGFPDVNAKCHEAHSMP